VPHQITLGAAARTLLRWPIGLAVVSWHYMWRVTPLHRSEEAGDSGDLPPPLPTGCVDGRLQRHDDGVGPLWHRLFGVRIEGGRLQPSELISAVAADLNAAAPTEVAVFCKLAGHDGELAVGDEYVVRLPAPWNGPVRVVHRRNTSVRFATLQGHMEAGQVEFRAEGDGTALRFTIETWHRCATRPVELLYARLRLAKEIQLNMWVRYCTGAAKVAGGRPRGGVTIRTRRLDGQPGAHPDRSRERTGS
jgi:hypothetical protein